MIYYTREQIIELTSQWKGERSEDGRPRVPDYLLEKLRSMTIEEVWLPLYLKDYKFQFEGDFKKLHAEKKLVGRAVTATFMPTRPDLMEVVTAEGKAKGYDGTCNQWVVDHLVDGDVVVTDMFDKVWNGTFVGGNLTTAINVRTKTGGAIIWGGVRDIEQMQKIDTQVYYRGTDPTPIRECLMTSYNGPTKIGNAICMPGDIVMGTISGVLFIPAQFVEEIVNSAEKSQAKDVFGFAMLAQGTYTAAEIDSTVWHKKMVDHMIDFIEHDPSCEKYHGLDWSLEINAANGDEEAITEMMKGYLI
ncbi:MAG: RraA family protein [Hungatella sp.]